MDKEKIVNDNIKMIYDISKKFYGTPREDLVQAGMVGLFKAYENYDESSKAKFSTYAYKSIFGEMYLLATKRPIKINRDILRMYDLIEKTRYEEAQRLGYVPRNDEISKIINLPLETVDFACNSAINYYYLDAESDSDKSLHERLSYDENISLDDKLSLYEAIDALPSPEKEILLERYFKDETQAGVARKLKMTQVKVSRYEKKGLSKMREYMTM